MLDYLIPSATRRQLLQALFLEGERGTVSSLARRADVSTAAAHAELAAMEGAGLVRRRLENARRIYEAVGDHPHVKTLRSLLELPLLEEAGPAQGAGTPLEDPNGAKNDLAALGARLRGHRVSTKTSTPLELALARGVVLARHDTAVARAMPGLLAKHRGRIDFGRLADVLTELRHKHTGGFLMALAADLVSDASLRREAEQLRDHRRHRVHDFFAHQAGAGRAEDPDTLPLALDWQFHYPLPLANFPKPPR